MREKSLLALTMGDVNGVGPEVIARALARPEPWEKCLPVVYGSAAVLDQARRFAPGCPEPVSIRNLDAAAAVRDGVPVMEEGIAAPEVRPGVIDPEAGACAVTWIEAAVRAALRERVAGLVTAPISKECIHLAGCPYSGHTELIADMCGSPDYRMCLFTDTMRIVHITSHLSMRDAVSAVRLERIAVSIRVGYQALRRMGMAEPRIAVAGLNPHAGEAGAFGREEIEEIAPAIAVCTEEGIRCSGPYPPDTVFRRMADGEFDMVISMYHDQGHIPLKLVAMDEGVNVTLGIPIVRTSVDHGTAFDIAWKGMAREHSLCAAIAMAVQLSGHDVPHRGSGDRS